MSRSYPKLGITLSGEPAAVRSLADSLKAATERMNGVAGKTTNISRYVEGGGTRERCMRAVGALNESIDLSARSIGDSATRLSAWADYIDQTRDKLAPLERNVAMNEQLLEEAEAELRSLQIPATQDDRHQALLYRHINELCTMIEHNRNEGHKILDAYDHQATTVGDALRSDGLSSPYYSAKDRPARELLRTAHELAKGANVLIIGGGIAGKIGTKLATRFGIKALEELLGHIGSRAVVSGIGLEVGKMGVTAAANLSGARVHPLEYVFDALSIGKESAKTYLDHRFGDVRALNAANAAAGTYEGGQHAPDPKPARVHQAHP